LWLFLITSLITELCKKKKILLKFCFQHFLFALAEEGQAIYVTSATYGRTDKKTCSAGRPADQLKNTECFTYAEEVGERCNGKQWCKVKASNYVFGDPCYGTYKYLEVEYICYDFQHFVFCLPTAHEDIFVISAKYGRSDRMTCSVGIPAEQTKNTNCYRASIFPKGCEGKSTCNVLASSSVFGDPCVGTYKYLDVIYLSWLPEKKSLVACEGTVARLHCGQAIYVTSATYGRTDKKTCSAGRPADQLENTECFTYAEEVGERCNGKQWCKVKASNYVFGDPCYGTYKYLEVEYICYGEFRLSLH
uniref:SUEL-type lectin domain-containing protein n=1 Tax=Xiphophorus maculatus TaxID=8083 RepID=A0A3B5R5S8_XIPMA